MSDLREGLEKLAKELRAWTGGLCLTPTMQECHDEAKRCLALLAAGAEEPGETAHAVICPLCNHHFYLGCENFAKCEQLGRDKAEAGEWRGPMECERGHRFEPPYDEEALKHFRDNKPCIFDGSPLHRFERRIRPVPAASTEGLIRKALVMARDTFVGLQGLRVEGMPEGREVLIFTNQLAALDAALRGEVKV